MSDLKKSYSNLERALNELDDYLSVSTPSKVERAGIIQGFEFCFELFWKLFKKISEDEGLQAGSPKAALRAAYQQQFFKDQDLWLQMLEDRNLTVHTYNEQLSKDIYSRIKSHYKAEFDRVFKEIKGKFPGN